jgi:hypothetical protein
MTAEKHNLFIKLLDTICIEPPNHIQPLYMHTTTTEIKPDALY